MGGEREREKEKQYKYIIICYIEIFCTSDFSSFLVIVAS